jgi:hypothetical protein
MMLKLIFGNPFAAIQQQLDRIERKLDSLVASDTELQRLERVLEESRIKLAAAVAKSKEN